MMSGWWTEHWRTVVLSSCVAFVFNVTAYGFALSQISTADTHACNNVLALRDSVSTIFLRAYGSIDPDTAQKLAIRLKLPLAAVPTQPAPQNMHLSEARRLASQQFFTEAIGDLTALRC